MNDLFQIFLLSMTPFGEIRLSVPLGLVFFHQDPILVFIVAVLGNFTAAAFLLLFLKKISVYLSKKSRIFKETFSWWESNAKEKHFEKINKYGIIGLALFVAIPFPFTGAWTGALLATLADMPLKKALPAIFTGIAIAGLIVTAAVLLGINITEYLGWQAFIIFLIIICLIALIWNFKKNKK